MIFTRCISGEAGKFPSVTRSKPVPYLNSDNSRNRHGDADFTSRNFWEYSAPSAKQEMILGLFLSSWHRARI